MPTAKLGASPQRRRHRSQWFQGLVWCLAARNACVSTMTVCTEAEWPLRGRGSLSLPWRAYAERISLLPTAESGDREGFKHLERFGRSQARICVAGLKAKRCNFSLLTSMPCPAVIGRAAFPRVTEIALKISCSPRRINPVISPPGCAFSNAL